MTIEKGLIFTGLEIQLCKNIHIILSQKQYVSELPTTDIAQYISRDIIANQKDLQSTFRQGLGALIWAHQTRPDVGFLITKIATDLITACIYSVTAIQLSNCITKRCDI